MQILTSEQHKAAMAELGFSQRRVAKDTGLPRGLLSLFEQQRAIPTDDFLEALRDFYIGQGIDWLDAVDLVPDEADDIDNIDEGLETFPEGPHPDQLARDGFLYPSNISVEKVDGVFDEIENIDAKIAEALDKPVKLHGIPLVAEPTIPTEKDRTHLLALMARAYCLVRSIQGRTTVSPCRAPVAELPVGGETGDQRGWLEQLFGDIFGFDEDPDEVPHEGADDEKEEGVSSWFF
jgi:transcriptional regulator with XRE-family HTH domain